MMSGTIKPKDYSLFGEYIKAQREALGKSIRGLATEIDITPAYLSDIEKGNRYAPENYLDKMIEALKIPNDHVYDFYDLAGKSRKDVFPDITPYIGEKPLARLALRRARDLKIPDSKWQEFIDEMNKE